MALKGILAVGVIALILAAWWTIDRPFGGVTCWVNYTAATSAEAAELQAELERRGLDARIPPPKREPPQALPVVEVEGGFWSSEGSLEAEVLAALEEVGTGRFDQCRAASLGS